MNISSFYVSNKNKLRENILLFLIISILAYFIIFSKSNFQIMSDIISIFINIIVPSLFPFILFGNILTSSGYFYLIAKSKLCLLLQKIFNTSYHGTSAIIFGFLFGYPNGARYINDLYMENKISHKEAEYLLLFVNNASPTFILSSIGIGMFGNISIGVILLISHVIASILIRIYI